MTKKIDFTPNIKNRLNFIIDFIFDKQNEIFTEKSLVFSILKQFADY